MEIGRKIYYELSTGNVIVDTGERQGSVVSTTTDQDFKLYAALKPYNQDAVGILQLDYGHEKESFSKYRYNVDPVLKDVVFDQNAILTDQKNVKIQEFSDDCENIIFAGFVASSNGHTYDFALMDQINMTQQHLILMSDPTITSVLWKTEDAGVLSHTRQEFINVVKDAQNFKLNTIGKYWSLKATVQSCTTVDQVNSITWS